MRANRITVEDAYYTTEPVCSKETFWACRLAKDSPVACWEFQQIKSTERHTLFLKQAVLGKTSVADERNVVEVETNNFLMKKLKIPIISLRAGVNEMCNLDLNFSQENKTIFRLIEGTGPVFLSAQQCTEFFQDPEEAEEAEDVEGEGEEEGEEEGEGEEEKEEEEDEPDEPVEPGPEVSKKRKASGNSSAKPPNKVRKKKAEEKIIDANEEEDENDEEDEEMEDGADEVAEEEAEEEDSPEIPVKKSRKDSKKSKESAYSSKKEKSSRKK